MGVGQCFIPPQCLDQTLFVVYFIYLICICSNVLLHVVKAVKIK